MAEGPDLTVSENQRLKREVRQLNQRVAALESSRWWRLHPRFLLRRLRPRTTDDAPPSSAATPERAADPVAERFRREVFARGRFTEDWFSMHIPAWEPVMRELEGRAANVLELGSFEGLSASWVLWRLPDARLTCVDTFAGIEGYEAYGITTDTSEAFDHNVALFDGQRTHKLAGETHSVLPALVDAGDQFDLIYVDASHLAVDVLADAAFAWKLLRPGGVVIFDDYGLVPPGDDPLDHPQPALNAFRELVASRADILGADRQLMLRKKG